MVVLGARGGGICIPVVGVGLRQAQVETALGVSPSIEDEAGGATEVGLCERSACREKPLKCGVRRGIDGQWEHSHERPNLPVGAGKPGVPQCPRGTSTNEAEPHAGGDVGGDTGALLRSLESLAEQSNLLRLNAAM